MSSLLATRTRISHEGKIELKFVVITIGNGADDPISGGSKWCRRGKRRGAGQKAEQKPSQANNIVNAIT